MKRLVQASLFGLVLLLIGTGFVFARDFSKENPDLVVGAQLYDKWYAVLGVEAPLGELFRMPWLGLQRQHRSLCKRFALHRIPQPDHYHAKYDPSRYRRSFERQ
jgi:hypothetical protein